MVARRFNEADVDFEAIDGDLAKLAPPKLSAERRPGPSARPHGRATGQGRHGGADARSAEGARHRDRRAQSQGLHRQGRAAGTQDGEVRGERHGFGRKAATPSKRHGAKRRAPEGDIAQRAMSRRRSWGERGNGISARRAPSNCCEFVREGKAARGALLRGRSVSDAPRCASARRGERAAERTRSGATEPRRREGGVLPSSPASEARSERKRAEAPGIVTRRAKTAKRASWSRAGRSRARRNRARRPARRAGRAPVLDQLDRRSGRYRAVIHAIGWE